MTETATILGIGVCSPFGDSVQELISACLEGRVLANPPVAAVCPADFVNDAVLIEHPDQQPIGRAGRLLRRAVMTAIRDCDLAMELRARAPLYIGTGLRGLRDLEISATEGNSVPKGVLDVGATIRHELGLARHIVVSNACSAGLFALSLALADLSGQDHPPCVIVAGVDTVTESLFALIRQVQGGGPQRITPFYVERRGTLLGEGAAAMVVGPISRATSDRPRILSVATNCDAWHVTAPHVESIAEVTREAHRQADVRAEDIDLVMLHGTGTRANDASESLAMTEVFGHLGLSGPAMTTIKGTTGHTAGASGLQSLILGMDAIRTCRVPGITGLSMSIQEASELHLVRASCRRKVQTVQVNAFGFGGLNAVAILGGGV